MKRMIPSFVSAATLLCAAVAIAQQPAQQPVTPPSTPVVAPATTAIAAPPVTSAAAPGSAAEDAERAKIWNSPTMLRARAWVQEYCARSAKITPAEAQQYMDELEHLSPVQMKLWLLKFDHEEETIRQQQADFQRSRSAGVAQATTVNAATDQAYSNINRDETDAAQLEEQSLTTEQAQANARDMQNDASRDADNAALHGPLYGGYGGYPYGGYNPLGAFGNGGAGDIHIHVHQ